MRRLFCIIALMAVVSVVTAQSAVVIEKEPVDIISIEKKDSQVVKSRFSWGLDAGSAIDMTGNDMSAIDINAYFGYSGSYVRFAGVGAGIDMMVSSSSNTCPIYALFRTDFRPTPQLCFLETRGGIAFSNIESYHRQTTPFGSIGIGVTLAKGRTFSSHIILSYNYIKLDNIRLSDDRGVVRVHDLQYATMRIGISF